MAKRKINYLNNRDLLLEIHKSKNTFCYYTSKEYEDYDIIVYNIADITDELIKQAKENRSDKVNRIIKENSDKNPKLTSSADFDKLDLIFRVMDETHIPEEIRKNKKAKNLSNRERVVKLNFNPFKHYIFNETGELVEVGRSHWSNGLENGGFCLSQGRLTNKLAMMSLKLVERYSQKGNWRGYTWLEDMKGQALMQLIDVALKFDEAKSQNPFAYFTCIVTNSFRGTLNSEDKVSTIKNKMMIESGYSPSHSYAMDNESGGSYNTYE